MGTYVLLASGLDIWRAPGTEMWQTDDEGVYSEIGEAWKWSVTKHYHYLVQLIENPPGGYWIPASTNPPFYMKKWWTPIKGTYPLGNNFINKNAREYHPSGTFLWIPKSFFNKQNQNNYRLIERSNYVACMDAPPDTYPPKNPDKENIGKEKKESKSNKSEPVFSFSADKSSKSDSPSPPSSPGSRSTSMELD